MAEMSRISIKKSQPILVEPETKSNHGYYFLSNIDQNFLSIVQTAYYYKPDNNKSSENVADVIKEALARVLVHFYPLAGSLTMSDEGKYIVKCTNAGVPFVSAEADCDIDELGDITGPNSARLGELVYTKPEAKNGLERPLLTAQVTRFKCGGFVMGMTIYHCMVDGISAMEFVNSWGETARGKTLSIPPAIDRTILNSRQPPKIEYPHAQYVDVEDISNMSTLFQQEKVILKPFDFLPEKLARIKEMAMEDGVIKTCSTFTALTALVWRARSKALHMKPDQQTKLLVAVDGRSKFNPPLPKGYFGNAIIFACCICSARELIEKPLSFAVEHVQNAIKMLTEDFIRSVMDYIEVNRPTTSLSATLIVTSWTRLAFDTTDFGWGGPTQAGCVTMPAKEVALFLSKGRDQKKGITVLVCLPTSSMKIFEELMQV